MRYESPLKVAEMLRRGNFRLGHEKLLHEDVAELFARNSVVCWSEYQIGPGERLDFFIDGGIALELKIKCSPRMMMRQLQRYSAHDVVKAIILVTASACSMPRELNGKPVIVVNLGAGYL